MNVSVEVKVSQIPPSHLRAIALGAPDFLEAVLESASQQFDPEMRVIRATMEGFTPIWYVEVIGADRKRTVCLVDRREREAMIPLTSIYLADLLSSLREELFGVFEQDCIGEEMLRVAPFIGLYGSKKAS